MIQGSVGFIGAGHMAEAMIQGMLKTGDKKPGEIFIKELLPQRQAYMAETYGVRAFESWQDFVCETEVFILGVRPQDVKKTCEEIRGFLPGGSLVVSICAGILARDMEEWLGEAKVARVMPNTSIESGKGYSALYFHGEFTQGEKQKVLQVTEAIGSTMEIKEEMFDAFTAVSCAAPQYYLMFMAALIDAGVESGFSRSDVRKIMIAGAYGAAYKLEHSDKNPNAFTDDMCTPGGIGIAALHSFQKSGIHAGVMDGVAAALKRSKELRQGEILT